MTTLSEPLEKLCRSVPGAVAATIMGVDGLPVDTHTASEDGTGEMDLASLLVEYSSLLSQVQRSAQMFAAGGLEELSIKAEHLTTIIRPINDEYFLAIALAPHANFGKGRYHLRLIAPTLVGELS